MEIIKNKKNNKNELLIIGNLIEVSEKEIFFNTLNIQDDVIDLISFIDAVMLSDEILIFLYKKGYINSIATKIIIYNGYLYSYLIKLGIKNVHYSKNSNTYVYDGYKANVLEDNTLEKNQVKEFLDKIHDIYGYNYKEYRLESIKRRIKIGMLKAGMDDFYKYTGHVLNNKDVFEDLFLELSINVTDFFRDPNTFLVIRNSVLPFLDSFPHLKIWCAGCSSGEEAYSLAILLHEYDMLKKTIIYATDINGYIIEEAKNGIFSSEKISIAEDNYIKSGGKNNFKSYFEQYDCFHRITPKFNKKILFFSHSLLESGILNEFNLILCRNVLIYFEPGLQERIIGLFKDSLDISGFMILGRSEGIFLDNKNKKFEIYDKDNKIYKNYI